MRFYARRYLHRNVTLMRLGVPSPTGVVYGKEWADIVRSRRSFPGFLRSDREEWNDLIAFEVVCSWTKDRELRGTIRPCLNEPGAALKKLLSEDYPVVFCPVAKGDFVSGTTMVDPLRSVLIGFDAIPGR